MRYMLEVKETYRLDVEIPLEEEEYAEDYVLDNYFAGNFDEALKLDKAEVLSCYEMKEGEEKEEEE